MYAVNSLIVTTSGKQWSPISDLFEMTVLFLSQILFQKLSHNLLMTATTFFKQKFDIFFHFLFPTSDYLT